MTAARVCPPLRVFGYAIAIFCAVLMVIGTLPSFMMHSRNDQDPLNLARIAAARPGASRVVAIGTSATRYAVDFDDALLTRLPAESPAMAFTRVTWPSANFSDMAPAFAALREHPPEILLVETSLLLFDAGHQFTVKGRLQVIEGRIEALLRGSAAPRERVDENRGTAESIGPGECLDKQSRFYRMRYAVRMASLPMLAPARLVLQSFVAQMHNVSLLSAEMRERYLAELRALRNAGTRVVLVTVPRAAWADALVPRAIMTMNDSLVDRMVAEEHFASWVPSQPPESAICDEGHFNAEGRALYSAWLAGKLGGAAPHE